MVNQIRNLHSSVFYKRFDNGLLQKHELTLSSDTAGDVKVTFMSYSWLIDVLLGSVPAGESIHEVYLPDYREITEIRVTCEGIQALFIMQPRKHWELHVVPVTHHDMGYTKPMDDILNDYDHYYDDILSYLDRTSYYPDESRYRYTVECSMTFLHYLERKTPEQIEKYLKYIREGRVEVSAFYSHVIDGNAGREEMIRLMYPTFSLKAKYGIPITSAAIVDMPGMSSMIPVLLAGAGIKYFFAGIPNYFAWNKPGYALPKVNFWDEQAVLGSVGSPTAFFWEAPDGSRVLVYYQGGYGLAFRNYHDALPDVAKKVEKRLMALEGKGLTFDVDRYIDFGGDNLPPRLDISRIAAQWNEEYVFPKVIVSTNTRFFEALSRSDINMKTIHGEIPHTDYTVNSYSAAFETALSRRTHERLLSLEALAAANCMIGNGQGNADDIMRIYRDLLTYDEHTFGMYIPMGLEQDWSWNSKRGYVLRAAFRTENLICDKIRQLSESVNPGRRGRYITVFNALSAARTDLVRVSNFDWFDKSFKIIDCRTQKSIPCQLVKINRPDEAKPYASYRYAMGVQDALVVTKNKVQPDKEFLYDLLFIAVDMPPLGYSVFFIEMCSAEGNTEGSINDAPDRNRRSIENKLYRILADPGSGALCSIYDKKNELELVDSASEHGFNQLIMHQVETGTMTKSQLAGIFVSEQGPVLTTLSIRAVCGEGIHLMQDITLYEQLDRIDISNRIVKDSTPFQELYFAFPFALNEPHFSLETTGMDRMKPFEDQMQGSNTNYYSVQHWGLVQNEAASVVFVPVDANILEFGGLWPCCVSQGHHGVGPANFGECYVTRERMHEKGSVYSFVMNNNYRTNFCSVQQTDCLFRYSFRTWPGSVGYENGVSQFGRQVTSPLISTVAEGDSGPLPIAGSFCTLSHRGIHVQALKSAEDGRGFIIRLHESEGLPLHVQIQMPYLVLARINRTDIVEQDMDEMIPCSLHDFSVNLQPYETATLRMQCGYIDDAGYGSYRDHGEFQRGLYSV